MLSLLLLLLRVLLLLLLLATFASWSGAKGGSSMLPACAKAIPLGPLRLYWNTLLLTCCSCAAVFICAPVAQKFTNESPPTPRQVRLFSDDDDDYVLQAAWRL
jgi:hypothetical protein